MKNYLFFYFYFLLLFVHGQNLVSVNSPKFIETDFIYQKLIRNLGATKLPPKLQMIDNTKTPAGTIIQYIPTGAVPIIRIDEKVYNLCYSLGKQQGREALAMLLGHELTHHFREHSWYYTYGIAKNSNKTSVDDKERMESEADFYGCLAAHMSGLYSEKTFEVILGKIYESYQIREPLKGYILKSRRIQLYEKKLSELRRLTGLFDVAQLLYATRQFEVAAQVYQYIGYRFASIEIFNNWAACLIQQVLIHKEKHSRWAFRYPVELEFSSRLKLIVKSDTFDEESLLIKAEDLLQKALLREPRFEAARVNLACVFDLQSKSRMAIEQINTLTNYGALSPDALNIKAIAEYHVGEKEQAKNDFERAARDGNIPASYNLAKFNELNPSVWSKIIALADEFFPNENGVPQTKSLKESIANKFPSQVHSVDEWVLESSPQKYLAYANGSFTNDGLRFWTIRTPSQKSVYLSTLSKYLGQSTKGIKIKSSTEQVKSLYGNASWVWRASFNQSLWVYPQSKLIFGIDADNKVTTWWVYQ